MYGHVGVEQPFSIVFMEAFNQFIIQGSNRKKSEVDVKQKQRKKKKQKTRVCPTDLAVV